MISRFLIFCSGADSDILKQCPMERPKYIGIGTAILITSVFAIISGMYFLAFAFTDKNGKLEISFTALLLFGLLWGLLIFNIDKNIVISMNKDGKGKKKFNQVAMRVVLAVFIGFVISTPLELKLFSDEVEDKLADNIRLSKNASNQENYNLYAQDIHLLDSTIKVIKNDLDTKEKRRNELYESFKEEAEGTGGTYKRGKGPVYAEKKEEFDKADSLYNTVLIALGTKRQEKDSLIKIIGEKNIQTGQAKDSINGLEARVKALYQLSITHWFITFLFILIEIIPITVKLFSNRGPYDEIKETLEHEFKFREAKKKQHIEIKLNNEFEIEKMKSDLEKDACIKAETDKYNADIKANDEILDKLSKKQSELIDIAAEKWFKDASSSMNTANI